MGFATDLASWACQKKSPEFIFQNRFNKKQNPPDSSLKSGIISEHPKILQILSIRLTDWKLSKRNRPKVASNSCQRQKKYKVQKVKLQQIPSLNTSPPKKKTSEWRSKGVSVFGPILVLVGCQLLSEVVGGRSHNKRSERSVSEHKGWLGFIKRYYPPSSCHKKSWNIPQQNEHKLCFDCLQMEGQPWDY